VGVFDCSRRAGERIFLRNLRTSSRRCDCEIAAANAVSCQSLFESISLNLRPSGKAPPVRKASISTGDVPTASAPRVRWRHTYRMLLQWSAPSPRCASRPHRRSTTPAQANWPPLPFPCRRLACPRKETHRAIEKARGALDKARRKHEEGAADIRA